MGADRRDLVRNVWPDKALFGATLLLITAFLGLLQGVALMAVPIKTAGAVTALVNLYPPILVTLLSAAAAVLAALSLKRQRSVYALWGCLVGFAAFGMVGLGSVLSAVAFVFVVLSRVEGEDAGEGAARVTASTWPDKALAASTVLTVSGVLTLGWGWALATDAVQFAGYTDDPGLFGILTILAGLVALVAAGLMYRQQAPWLGVIACLAGVLTLGLYVIAPVLSLVGLVLIWKAHKEGEFQA